MEAANELVKRAQAMISQKRWDLAEPLLRGALECEPQHSTAPVLLAAALMSLNRWDEGVEIARVAVSQRPDYAHAHSTLATGLVQLKRFKEALAAANESLRLAPQQANYYVLPAMTLYDLDRFNEALGLAERGLALNPNLSSLLQIRAGSLTKLGRGEDARRAIDDSLRRAPSGGSAHANASWCYLHLHDRNLAEKHAKQALALEPASFLSHYVMGLLRKTEGRIDQAKAHLKESLRINKWDARSRRALKEIIAAEKQAKRSASFKM